MPTTTTTDPGTLIAAAANTLGPGLVQLVGAALLLAIVAIIITVVWRTIR
jgi:hypothetical protein